MHTLTLMHGGWGGGGKLAGSCDMRATVLKERSVNDSLGLNRLPNLEE